MKKRYAIIGTAAMAGFAALTGCMTSVKSKWEQDTTGTIRAEVSVLSTGTQSEALAKGFDAGPQGSILEDASGKQDSTTVVAAIRDVFVAFAPLMNTLAGGASGAARAPAAAPQSEGGAQSVSETLRDPPDADAQTAYAPDGYSAAPGPGGEGVYGSPSCGRCRAYRAAHPEANLINTDAPGNLADLFAALRLRGYTGKSVSLPVSITADGYTQAAR